MCHGHESWVGWGVANMTRQSHTMTIPKVSGLDVLRYKKCNVYCTFLLCAEIYSELLLFLYRAANAIFGKVGRVASEEVTLHLIKLKCIPVFDLRFFRFFPVRYYCLYN